MINKFFFTIFHWQGFLVHVDDQQVSLDKFRWLKINNILATFSLLSVYTSKFLTWQFFLVKEKLARQIFLDKENLSTIPRLHEQFFLVKANLSRKNCSCKWGFNHFHCTPAVMLSTNTKDGVEEQWSGIADFKTLPTDTRKTTQYKFPLPVGSEGVLLKFSFNQGLTVNHANLVCICPWLIIFRP